MAAARLVAGMLFAALPRAGAVSLLCPPSTGGGCASTRRVLFNEPPRMGFPVPLPASLPCRFSSRRLLLPRNPFLPLAATAGPPLPCSLLPSCSPRLKGSAGVSGGCQNRPLVTAAGPRAWGEADECSVRLGNRPGGRGDEIWGVLEGFSLSAVSGVGLALLGWAVSEVPDINRAVFPLQNKPWHLRGEGLPCWGAIPKNDTARPRGPSCSPVWLRR